MQKPRDPTSAEQYTASCDNCVLPELCLRAGLSPEDIQQLDQLVYARRKIRRGEDLYRAGGPFGAIYAIRTGFFKSERVLKDGRHQIMGFHMPGEMLGLDGIGTGAYACNAVALEVAEVCAIPLSRVEELSVQVRDLAHRLHQIMSDEIVRDQRVMVLLGGKGAESRLASFLVDISNRFAARGYAPADFDLPMTREEIGSYLGLTLETVSRMFSRLQADHLITVQQRHIRIVDPSGLEHMLETAA